MKNHILLLGAGRSSAGLIDYLSREAARHGWRVTLGDLSEPAAEQAVKGKEHINVIHFDLSDYNKASEEISNASVVISLLPPHLHPEAARLCLKHKKHFLTASYVGESMRSLDQDAQDAGLLFLNECGLDPGIDHMSAMEMIDSIKSKGGVLKSFRSFTGGLISPDTAPENPWRYLFTWNARNVVTAGQGVATYLEDGTERRIPYQKLFRRLFPIEVSGVGKFDGYANRDSLQYREIYGLEKIPTLMRGTLRYSGYCQAWDLLVQLGVCDDHAECLTTENQSSADFIEKFLPPGSGDLRERVAHYLGIEKNDPRLELLEWSGIFSHEAIGKISKTAAATTELILNKKWKMKPQDKDMIVMWHQFVYHLDGKEREIQSNLVVEGVAGGLTAMAKTVGLPLGIAAKLLLEGKLSLRGVQIPVRREFYEPILAELSINGITLKENQIK